MDAKKPAQSAKAGPAVPRPAVKPAARPAATTAAKPSPEVAPKAAARAAKPVQPVQPTSFMNWLGRQVGHVKSAVKTDPARPAGKPRTAGKPPSKPAAAGPQHRPRAACPAPTAAGGGIVVYREDKVEEAEMPDRPGVILRRTIIDEVVVETPPAPPPQHPAPGAGPGSPRR